MSEYTNGVLVGIGAATIIYVIVMVLIFTMPPFGRGKQLRCSVCDGHDVDCHICGCRKEVR